MALDPKNPNTINTLDKLVHARKRRVLNSVFSTQGIQSAEKYVLQHVDRWNELTIDGDGKDWGKPRDFSEWVDFLVLDILGDLAFGKSLETKEPEENSLKAIPHSISQSLQFIVPVTLALNYLRAVLITRSDCTISISRFVAVAAPSRSQLSSQSAQIPVRQELQKVCRR